MDWNFAWARTRAGFYQIVGLSEQALEVYRKILAGRQDAPCARVAALMAAKARQFKEAEYWYAKAAEWDPADIETWFNLGYLRDMLEQKREALVAFEHAVKLAPHFDRAWHAIGKMHADLDEHARAIEPLRKALAVQSMNTSIIYLIGYCQHKCGNEKAVRDTVQELSNLDKARAQKLIDETGRKDLQRLLDKAD